MGVRFACHQCGKRLNIKRELAGKRGVCPACSARFRIPLGDAERSQPLPDRPAGGEGRNRRGTPAVETAGVAEATEEASAPGAAEPQPSQVGQAHPATGGSSDSEPPESVADEPAATWYVRPPSGGQYGPATSEVLREWVDEGRLAASALVWRDGWPQWRVAREAFPQWIDRLPGAGEQSERAAAPATGSDRAIDGPSEPAGDSSPAGGEPTLQGEANVAAVRRRHASRRVVVIGLLFAISVALVAILVILLMR